MVVCIIYIYISQTCIRVLYLDHILLQMNEERQADTKIYREREGERKRCMNRLTDRQTHRDIDRSINRWID